MTRNRFIVQALAIGTLLLSACAPSSAKEDPTSTAIPTETPNPLLYAKIGSQPLPDGTSVNDDPSYTLTQARVCLDVDDVTGCNLYDLSVENAHVIFDYDATHKEVVVATGTDGIGRDYEPTSDVVSVIPGSDGNSTIMGVSFTAPPKLEITLLDGTTAEACLGEVLPPTQSLNGDWEASYKLCSERR